MKERFAGQLSEGEAALCSNLQESFRATLNGQRSFEIEMIFLWAQLHKLRKFNFDVEEAIASGEFGSGIPRVVEIESDSAGDAPNPFGRRKGPS